MERIRGQLGELCRGWSADQVGEIVRRHLAQKIVPYVYARAQELLAEHNAAGHDVIIVSSSGQEMVAPIGALLGVSQIIATRMQVAAGCYTGVTEFYAYGEAKAQSIRELAAERGYRLAECHAYSDSVTDVPMLEVVGHPHVVNPDRALRKIARDRDWPVLAFTDLVAGNWPESGHKPETVCGIAIPRTTPSPAHEITVFNRDHEFVTAKGFPRPRIRRRKVSRTVTFGHGSRVPTRDQPREACRGR